MRTTAVFLAIASLFATAAQARQSGESSDFVFHFTNAAAPQGMQEITNAVRTILELRQVSVDMQSRSLTVHATPANIALSQWLFQELDVPESPRPQNLQVDRNPNLAGSGDQLRVYRLAHIDSIQAFQETINAIRTIPEITKVFPSARTWSIAVRGDEDRLAMAEWLLNQFDQPALPQSQARPEQQFQTPDPRGPELRVLYLAHANTPQGFQEVVNAIRTIPELTKVFPVTAQSAIAIRGTADRIAMAEWLYAELDKSGPEPTTKASAIHEFRPGADVVRVFFLHSSITLQSFQETVNTLRTMTQSPRIFPCHSSGALVFRGTPEQLTQAEGILKGTAQF